MNCPKCNAPLEGNEAFCPSCGVFISQEAPMVPTINVEPSSDSTYNYTDTAPNMHVQATYSHQPGTVPAEIKKWNWGAFFFNIMWGIGNYSYLPLLCLIPIFNIVWIFICGAKGNEWAWKSGKFDNVEDFLATQATWNRAGFVAFIVGIIFFVLYILVLISIFAVGASSYLYY